MSQVVQSEELGSFYHDYLYWITELGAPHRQPFMRDDGLCLSIAMWCMEMEISHPEAQLLTGEMIRQFIAAGLDNVYPFNPGRSPAFGKEVRSMTCYQNAKRIQWVKDHVSP